jgi:hypothetical protein
MNIRSEHLDALRDVGYTDIQASFSTWYGRIRDISPQRLTPCSAAKPG